ncbi:hypothetical protein ACFQ1R_09415 [Mariniflexile jejuense]|uniref:Uncharacterized protein n=1 Tax=Mariniflexile jejuense TaxID=1173582 RepID=A0ABW3JK78_9FLAO
MAFYFNEAYAYKFLQKFQENDTLYMTSYSEEDKIAWNILVKRGIIENIGGTQFSITLKGKQVLKAGGWNKYLKLEELKEEKRVDKENFDFLISKFQAKSQLLPYFLSALSLMIAFFAYFKPINKSNNKQLSKDEIIHIVDSISTSSQTKKVDSLRSSKTQCDSLIKK